MRLTAVLAAVVLLLLGLARAQEPAALRLAHLSPDAPRVDLVIDGNLFLRDLAYGQVSPFTALPAGEHEISVYPHRLPADPTGEVGARPLEPVTVVLGFEEGGYYTLALSGFYQPPPEDNTGSVRIDVEPDEARLQVEGPRGYARSFEGDTLLEDLEEGTYNVRAELEGFRPLTYEVTVAPAETSSLSITLQQGEEGPDAAEGRVPVEGPAAVWRGLELHAYRDDFSVVPPPGYARVRLLHLSPVTLPVDLLAAREDAGGEPVAIARGLEFPNESSYANVPAVAVSLRVRVAGSETVLQEIEGVTLAPGASYTFFLVREPGDNYLRLVPTVDAVYAVRR